jgi:hypothetical protein
MPWLVVTPRAALQAALFAFIFLDLRPAATVEEFPGELHCISVCSNTKGDPDLTLSSPKIRSLFQRRRSSHLWAGYFIGCVVHRK